MTEARWYRDVPMTIKPERRGDSATMRVFHDCPAEKPGTVLTTVDDVARRLQDACGYCSALDYGKHDHLDEAERLLGVTE